MHAIERRRFRQAGLAILALFAATAESWASDPKDRAVRPTIEDCASQLSGSQTVLEMMIISKAPRTLPQIVTNDLPGPAAAGPATRRLLTCWDKALGMPDPNNRSVSLAFGTRVVSRAPGLDASVRDAALETRNDQQAALYTGPTDNPRPALPECTSRYVRTGDFSIAATLVFSRSSERVALVNWVVRMADPIQFDDRELFQMFSRCLTASLGATRFLQQVEFSGGDILARSPQ